MDYLDKLNKFFRIFSEMDKQPKLWNIDTCVYNTWDRFSKKLIENNIKIDNSLYIDVVRVDKSAKTGQDRYKIFINDVDVTPYHKKRKITSWSQGATRQFLQEGSAMNVIFLGNSFKFNNFQERYRFDINYEVNCFFDEKIDWPRIIRNMIHRCTTSPIETIKNFWYSFLVCLLYKLDNKIFEKIDKVFFIKKMAKNNKNKCLFAKDKEAIEYIEKMLKETYGRMVKSFIAENNNIDSFVQELYDNILELSDDKLTLNEKNEFYFYNLINKINKERSNFRKNIEINRFGNKTPPKEYSDFWDINDDKMVECQPLNLLDAAHIYEIRKIKMNIKSKISNSGSSSSDLEALISDASNPKNGILIPQIYHRCFDRNQIGFNMNGELIYHDEDINKNLIRKVRISPLVFDDKMKFFLKKR